MPNCTFLRENHESDNPATASIPLDGLPQCPFHKRNPLGLGHVLLPVGVAVAIDVGASGPTNGVGLLMKGASERDAVDRAAVAGVVAGYNYSCAVEEG